MFTPNIHNGPAAATYVTASRNPMANEHCLSSDNDDDDGKDSRAVVQRNNIKKVSIQHNSFLFIII
jgi:hypothetical protein